MAIVNPDNPLSAALTNQWQSLAAMLIYKIGKGQPVEISIDEIKAAADLLEKGHDGNPVPHCVTMKIINANTPQETLRFALMPLEQGLELAGKDRAERTMGINCFVCGHAIETITEASEFRTNGGWKRLHNKCKCRACYKPLTSEDVAFKRPLCATCADRHMTNIPHRGKDDPRG